MLLALLLFPLSPATAPWSRSSRLLSLLLAPFQLAASLPVLLAPLFVWLLQDQTSLAQVSFLFFPFFFFRPSLFPSMIPAPAVRGGTVPGGGTPRGGRHATLSAPLGVVLPSLRPLVAAGPVVAAKPQKRAPQAKN